MRKELEGKRSLGTALCSVLLVLSLLGVMITPLFGPVSAGGSGGNGYTITYSKTVEGSENAGLLSQAFLPANMAQPKPTAVASDVSFAGAPPQLLINGTKVTGTLNGTGAYDLWYIFVSSKATILDAVLTCPNGTNYDLYGRLGDYPTLSDWDWAGTRYGGEVCNFTDPLAGWWYVMPYSQSGSGVYELTVNITYSSTARYLNNGESVLSYLNGTNDFGIWLIQVENGATSMRSSLVFFVSSLYLYERLGSTPSTSSYDYCSWGWSTLTIDYPYAGLWYVMPYSFSGSGIYQLTVTITYGNSTDGTTGLVAPIFYGLVIGFVLLSLFGALVVSRRRSNRSSGSRPAYRQEEAHSAEAVTKVAYREPIRPASFISCARCGARMKRGDEYCWNCGVAAKTSVAASPVLGGRTRVRARIGICMVCKLPLDGSDEVLLCPYCRRLAHKYELLEWLHVKDYCPSCGRHLSESKVKKRAVPKPRS